MTLKTTITTALLALFMLPMAALAISNGYERSITQVDIAPGQQTTDMVDTPYIIDAEMDVFQGYIVGVANAPTNMTLTVNGADIVFTNPVSGFFVLDYDAMLGPNDKLYIVGRLYADNEVSVNGTETYNGGAYDIDLTTNSPQGLSVLVRWMHKRMW